MGATSASRRRPTEAARPSSTSWPSRSARPNARADPAISRPRLETQVRLWRGREAVYEGAPTAMPVAHAAEHRVVAGGRLNLSSQLPPGDYTLQVVVTDTLAPRAQAVAMQAS